ncbi:MAG: hypothetical protein WEB53_07045, partial [Akkermansiaceae bacterium]
FNLIMHSVLNSKRAGFGALFWWCFLAPGFAQTTYTWDNGAGTSVWGTSANWVGDPALTFNNQTDIIFNATSLGVPAL